MKENGIDNPPRRKLLANTAGVLAAGGLAGWSAGAGAQTAPAAAPPGVKPLPAYVAWKNPAAMIVHTGNTLETRRSAFGTSVITPNEQVYIRNNLPPPASKSSPTVMPGK